MMPRGHRKIELCKTEHGKLQTCYERKSREHSMACPNCEGYRDPEQVVEREFLGWVPKDGTMKPVFSEGVRPLK
jgi:hypothetical protein